MARISICRWPVWNLPPFGSLAENLFDSALWFKVFLWYYPSGASTMWKGQPVHSVASEWED